eukprot:SAG31_NODE_6333_length_2062_cov_1.289862_2_plen_50_part_00
MFPFFYATKTQQQEQVMAAVANSAHANAMAIIAGMTDLPCQPQKISNGI